MVLPIVVWLALLCAGLVLAAILRTRQAFGIFRSIAGAMDRSTKRIGLVSSAPGIATAAWLALRGIDPPAAVVVGAACAFGVFAALLSIFHMEGLLLETSSEAAFRLAQGSPPPSTPRGRVVCALLGIMTIGATAYAISIVIR